MSTIWEFKKAGVTLKQKRMSTSAAYSSFERAFAGKQADKAATQPGE